MLSRFSLFPCTQYKTSDNTEFVLREIGPFISFMSSHEMRSERGKHEVSKLALSLSFAVVLLSLSQAKFN
jgi:hypothetical protein